MLSKPLFLVFYSYTASSMQVPFLHCISKITLNHTFCLEAAKLVSTSLHVI